MRMKGNGIDCVEMEERVNVKKPFPVMCSMQASEDKDVDNETLKMLIYTREYCRVPLLQPRQPWFGVGLTAFNA